MYMYLLKSGVPGVCTVHVYTCEVHTYSGTFICTCIAKEFNLLMFFPSRPFLPLPYITPTLHVVSLLVEFVSN